MTWAISGGQIQISTVHFCLTDLSGSFNLYGSMSYSKRKLTRFLSQTARLPCWSQSLKTMWKRFTTNPPTDHAWNRAKHHLWGRVSWFDVIRREDSCSSTCCARPPIPFFSCYHNNFSLLKAQVTLFSALVSVHGHIFWADMKITTS